MMSEENKYCEVCGKLISTSDSDYFSHIKIMYCDTCRKEVEREQSRLRMAELRKRKRQKDKFRDEELIRMQERVKLLEEENELLRLKVERQREELEQYQKEREQLKADFHSLVEAFNAFKVEIKTTLKKFKMENHQPSSGSFLGQIRRKV